MIASRYLSVSDDANNAAIFLDLLEICLDGLAAEIVLPFL